MARFVDDLIRLVQKIDLMFKDLKLRQKNFTKIPLDK